MSLDLVICCRVRLYAEGVQSLMSECDDVRVIGVANNDDDIRNLMQYKPSVVVADLECCKTALEILSGSGESSVLLLNNIDELTHDEIKRMIANGLGGILLKEADSKLLQKAVRKLSEGEIWFDNQTVRDVLHLKKEQKKKEIRLTKKETEILSFICTGLTNKEIAQKLYISEQTVKSHCNHLFKKFGVSSRLKLALTAPQCYPEGLNNRLQ